MGLISIFEPAFYTNYRAVYIFPRPSLAPLYLYWLSYTPQLGPSCQSFRNLEHPSEYDTFMDIYIGFLLSYTYPESPSPPWLLGS